MAENALRAALARGEFVCTAELVLGRDHVLDEAEAFVRDAARGQAVRVISVTDLPGGNPALPPEAFVADIAAQGLTPIAHLTGKDANRALIEGRLHALARAGLENVLALTGDAQRDGFGGMGKPVHDLDSVLILRLVEALRAGLEYRVGARTAATAPFDFFAGAVVNPFKVREPDLMMQLYKLELKIAAGARFIITQLGFNLRKLYELRQYMLREDLAHVPVLANVYVPTATLARMMQSGELAGCMASDELVRRLEQDKKAERLERAALMVAAVKELGFAGAHIGGFGLSYDDFAAIVERSAAIGAGWREHMDELVFPYPGEFYLLPAGPDGAIGLSDPAGAYQAARRRPRRTLKLSSSSLAHRLIIAPESLPGRFFAARLKPAADAGRAGGADSGDEAAGGQVGGEDEAAGGQAGGAAEAQAANGMKPEARPRDWRRGPWHALLKPSSIYRHRVLGCVDCGDCIQDHLSYAGCSMHYCYKELRNGPCGGSRPDGSCEVYPDRSCLWNLVYDATRAAGADPRRFARTLLPPRDWSLDGTNALANRYADIDNLPRRRQVSARRTAAE